MDTSPHEFRKFFEMVELDLDENYKANKKNFLTNFKKSVGASWKTMPKAKRNLKTSTQI